jgi:hypothetical protein
VPYKDARFDRCGRLDLKNTPYKWESRVLPAFAMLVTEPEHQGDFDYLESKLKDYPKYNSCKERY